MAKSFSNEEWEKIFKQLNQNQQYYGIPARNDKTIVFSSWNIRNFGEYSNKKGVTKKSKGAFDLIVHYCSQCDLIAIQEVNTPLSSIRELLRRLNTNNDHSEYAFIASDATGRSPVGRHGESGKPERLAFIYNTQRVQLGDIASDLAFDQTEILNNVNKSLVQFHAEARKNAKRNLLVQKLRRIADKGKYLVRGIRLVKGQLNNFITFIRTPHHVSFIVPGKDGHRYDIACVNAHLLSGRSRERKREFFTLLEWLHLATNNKTLMETTVTLLMADLNLDFNTSNKARRLAIDQTIVDMNKNNNFTARVNFPFLDDHPIHGKIFTNARASKTYDHIAIFSRDERFPPASQNFTEAGKEGDLGYDYGLFNFVKLFIDSDIGITKKETDYSKFEFDFTDHMPIWLRIKLPHRGQKVYSKK